MSIKTGCIITPISGVLDFGSLLYYGKLKKKKKREKRLGIIYPKNYENFKNRKSGSNFTGSYEKAVYQARILHYGKVLAYILAYVAMVFTYHLKRLWLLLCPLFKIGKGMCGRTAEPYGGESMRTFWIFIDGYVFDCQYYL